MYNLLKDQRHVILSIANYAI